MAGHSIPAFVRMPLLHDKEVVWCTCLGSICMSMKSLHLNTFLGLFICRKSLGDYEYIGFSALLSEIYDGNLDTNTLMFGME